MKWFTNVIPSSVVLLVGGLVLSGGCQPEPVHEDRDLDNDTLVARSALQVTAFDFLPHSPAALWQNVTGGLTWGINSAEGTVQQVAGTLENGISQTFLNTIPQAVTNGVVRGAFTVSVPAAATHPTLIATFGFQAGANTTDGVTFGITTQINGAWVPLFSQTKLYTGYLSTVAIDLTPYSGLTTQLFLGVDAGATGIADFAAWTDVRITADGVTAPSACAIGGSSFGIGDVHVGVDCQICDPIASAVAWTTRGGSCLINGQCYIAGTTDTTGCLKCVPGMSQISWTPQATCNIPGLVTVQNYDGSPLGTMQAVPSGNAWAFLAVPYAAPPTGTNRFAPPKPAPSWSGIQNHLTQPGPCAQKGFLDGLPNGYIGSEDCLYLNVWTPQTATPTSNLPVFVFHHGGGLMFGGSAAADDFVATQEYDGDRLAAAQNMVVVTLQTRLAALGYLASPELSADATSKTNPNGSTSGNYGLLDGLQALKWVKKNIAAFGGDPTHVTLAGQSGGATLAAMLLSSPLAKDPADNKPYFSSAFLMSGFYEEPSMATRYNQAAAIMPSLKAGCTDNSTPVNCLRSAPLSNFVNAAGDFQQFVPNMMNGPMTPDRLFGLPFGPNVDGYVIPSEPRTTFAAGQHQQVPVIMGGTHDEFNTFMTLGVAGALHALSTLNVFTAWSVVPTCTDYTNRANMNLGPTLASAALALYPCTGGIGTTGLLVGPTLAYSAAITHAQYECPLRRTAAALAGGQPGVAVRRYMFNHHADYVGLFQNLGGLVPQMGAAHALDLPYVFGYHEIIGAPTYLGPSPRETDLANRYGNFIRAFAATGDPNNSTLGTTWTAYSAGQDNLLSLDVAGGGGPGPQMVSGIDLQSGVGTSNCSFWDQNMALTPPSPPACTPACSGKLCGPDGCGGTCGTCGSGQLCSGDQSSCMSTVAMATVSGFTKCTCLNGSFPLTNTNGVWSSQPITGCPLQTQPAYVKLIQGNNSFGITNQGSQPGSGNSDYSHGTLISSSPYTASGNGSTAGNIGSFCPGVEDMSMHWTVSTAFQTQLTGVTYSQSDVYSANVAANYAYMNDGNANGSINNNETGTNAGANKFIMADVGTSKFIDHIVVGYDYLNSLPGGWGTSYTAGAIVEGSTDNASWTNITTLPSYASTGSSNGLASIPIEGTWRYIRLRQANNYLCTLEFQVWTNSINACMPSCSGKVCGSNGCGGSCGTCSAGSTCLANQTACCTPSCSGKVCGSDGCGGSCGTCTSPTTCNAGQTACVCTPSCSGKVCGSDGCGGSCGTCGSGTQCKADQTACAAPGATATVSGFTNCSCLNGTFPLTTNGSNVWSSVAVSGCPGQTLPAYVKFSDSSVAFGIASQPSTPGSGNGDYSPGTVITSSPYKATGGGATAGNTGSFCSSSEDQHMSWQVTKP